MKSHLAKVSLALLSAVFLLGCQEQGSGPVGPEGLGPEFGHKGSHNPGGGGGGGGGSGGEATFTATITVDVTSVGDILLGPPNGRKKTLQTLTGMPGGPDPVDAVLNLSFFQDVPDGDKCFADGEFTGPLQVGLQNAKDPDNARIGFWFDAKGTDGTPPVVKYLLGLRGQITSGNWPPDVNSSATITGSPGTFNIGHNSGPGSSVACSGTGSLNFSMEVVNTTT